MKNNKLFFKFSLFSLIILFLVTLLTCDKDKSDDTPSPKETDNIEDVEETEPTPVLPDIPASITVTPGGTTITVEWSAVEDAAFYEVWYSSYNDSETAIQVGGDIAELGYVISELDCGETYYVWVRSKNESGSSPFSAALECTPNTKCALMGGVCAHLDDPCPDGFFDWASLECPLGRESKCCLPDGSCTGIPGGHCVEWDATCPSGTGAYGSMDCPEGRYQQCCIPVR
ncbi:MAG: fibronectin type III domain-containing protein [Spirochaetes bacterium]|nr:fibronectin type III domain-containing protein [Spirochaetota bacterium]MBN2772009.1 fibronectin type III domain-containing protein [Spirochaetota bacterium]